MYGHPDSADVYYCPRCDRTIPKDRIEHADRELRDRFGVGRLGNLRCPICDSEFIDLDKVAEGGAKHVGEKRRPRVDR